MISEDRLQKALTYLSTTDEESAELKANVSRMEYVCKLARSRQFILAEGSVEARKAAAEVSEDVQVAEDKLADAIVAFEKMRAKRATEVLIVDVFRTLEASRRNGNI